MMSKPAPSSAWRHRHLPAHPGQGQALRRPLVRQQHVHDVVADCQYRQLIDRLQRKGLALPFHVGRQRVGRRDVGAVTGVAHRLLLPGRTQIRAFAPGHASLVPGGYRPIQDVPASAVGLLPFGRIIGEAAGPACPGVRAAMGRAFRPRAGGWAGLVPRVLYTEPDQQDCRTGYSLGHARGHRPGRTPRSRSVRSCSAATA